MTIVIQNPCVRFDAFLRLNDSFILSKKERTQKKKKILMFHLFLYNFSSAPMTINNI